MSQDAFNQVKEFRQSQPQAGGGQSLEMGAASMEPAGFWIRFLAFIIDWTIASVAANIVAVPLMIVGFAVAIGSAGAGADETTGGVVMIVIQLISFVLSTAVMLAYFGWFYKSKGATPGKMLFKLRVVNAETGENLGYGQTVMRELLGRFLCGITLLIGYIIAGVRDDKRGLHDMVANTQVLRRYE